MEIQLIPYPKMMHLQNEYIPLSTVSRPAPLEIAHRLRQGLSDECTGHVDVLGLAVRVEEESPSDGDGLTASRIGASADSPVSKELLALQSPEAYSLRVRDEGAVIRAQTVVGRTHALHTLAQLIWNFLPLGRLPLATIADWPSLPIRGFHVCYHLVTEFMPDLAPNFQELRRRIELMRHYKSNLLLLEIDAMFPYERHPLISSRIAFKRSELREIADLCRDNQVEIVPLVQCLGHAYNVLRHPQYAHLRELPGTTQQYCPTNPDVREFYMELVDEIQEVFPDIRRFHVGGDESRLLGACPRCQDESARIGVAGVYGQHVGQVCRRLLELGLTPYLWADMLEHWPDVEWSSYIPEGAVLVYWNYDILHWSREAAFNVLERTGRDIVTASAARFGTHNHTMYLYSRSMENIGILTRETQRRGLAGTIVTDWTKTVPHELSTISLVYGMSEAWGSAGTEAAFEQAFGRLHFGLGSTAADKLGAVYRLLEPTVPFCEDGQTHMLDRLDRYDLSGLTIRERIAKYASQDKNEDTRHRLRSAVARGEEALAISDELIAECEENQRELELLRLSARTQVHKAKMGMAFLESARLFRYPTPDDVPLRERVVAELVDLIREWSSLADETGRFLSPGTFPEVVEQAVLVKFEPEAKETMRRFLDLIKGGETGVRLF